MDNGISNKTTNRERFLELVSDEPTDTVERAKQRIKKRKAMKIDQEEFNRKAQHIIETVVKPQVAKYEQAKAKEMKKSIENLLIKQTLPIGGYKLGNTTLALTYKPKWIHRKMMKIFFGVQWVDATK
jgi:membrane-associated HD superfamily phosphohydrolase